MIMLHFDADFRRLCTKRQYTVIC